MISPVVAVEMDSSASVCTPRKHAICAFVDSTIKQGELLLKLDASLRARFVEFIKGGTWTDSLSCFEDSFNKNASSESPWRRFGYKSPHCFNGRNARTSFDKECSFKSHSTESECDTPSKSCSFTYKQMIMDECYSAISSCQLFKKNELRAVLIAALLPMFMKAGESSSTIDNSASLEEEGDGDDDGEEPEVLIPSDNTVRAFARSKTTTSMKSERLQEWLLGAAAMFDGSELEAYLADSNASWVDDYLRALHSLPVTMTLSTVDASKQESKIVYTNSTQGRRDQVGANMHEVYSADATANVVGQVTKAVFSAKKYKRCVITPNGLYKLRALKPVFCGSGLHAYTLGLESAPFEDPIIQDKSREECEAPFQQIEDLLLMLPLLIRNYDHQVKK